MSKYTAETRKKDATFTTGGKARFPMGDKTHAEQALREIKFAPESERAKIRARAATFGAGKSKTIGSKRKMR